MKKIMCSVLVMLCGLCLWHPCATAITYITTSGVTVEDDKAKYFSAYTTTGTSFIYNDAGGTAATAGWVPVRSATKRMIQYTIDNITGTATLTIEGTIIDSDTRTNIVGDITATTTKTGVIWIDEPWDQIRCGVKVTGGGSARVTVWGKFPGI